MYKEQDDVDYEIGDYDEPPRTVRTMNEIMEQLMEVIQIATLTTANLTSSKVDTLESKGYDLTFKVDRTAEGNYNVEILGEHNIEELDRLTEEG